MNNQLEIFVGREMHINSLCVYKEKVLPTISGRKKEVLEAIKALGGEATIYEIGQYLNKSLNIFSGRVTDLKRLGLIEDTGKNKVINERTFTIWKIKQ